MVGLIKNFFPFNGKIGFDCAKYVKEEAKEIEKRCEMFGKLYLEVGGKLFDDFHAARVLPGYEFDAKVNQLKEKGILLEFVVVFSAKYLEEGKRSSVGLSYRDFSLKMADELEELGFRVDTFVINAWRNERAAMTFKRYLERKDKAVFIRPFIKGYPKDISLIASEEGFGKPPFIETKSKVVVIVAPGPGSGKMSVALTMLYQDAIKKRCAGYAKIETFPVWNLPISSPINMAYEAATADLGDYNVIDPFEKEVGGMAVNYNRDVEAFPILRTIITNLLPKNHPMQNCLSPTRMGVNRVKDGIVDLKLCEEASKQEIVRRYFWYVEKMKRGQCGEKVVNRAREVMKKAGVGIGIRDVAVRARKMRGKGVVIKFSDGGFVSAKEHCYVSGVSSLLAKLCRVRISKHVLSAAENMHCLTGKGLSAKSMLGIMSFMGKDVCEIGERLFGAEMHANYLLDEEEKELLKTMGVHVTCG